MIAMFEHAYKLHPTNEELGAQTFFANVRTGNWKIAQQVPLHLTLNYCTADITLIILGGCQNAQTISRGSIFILERDQRCPPGF
jgi:hypothetical protein